MRVVVMKGGEAWRGGIVTEMKKIGPEVFLERNNRN
jgi:hypothetical protein